MTDQEIQLVSKHLRHFLKELSKDNVQYGILLGPGIFTNISILTDSRWRTRLSLASCFSTCKSGNFTSTMGAAILKFSFSRSLLAF